MSHAADNPMVLRVTTLGNDVAHATLADRNGNFYVAGLIDDPGASSTFGVAKFSAQGELLWRSSYDASGSTRLGAVRHLALDSEGNVLATGFIAVSSSATEAPLRQEVLTVKFASDGRQTWARRYAGTQGDALGVRVAVDAQGHVFVGGTSVRNSTDWLLLKYDRFGGLLAEHARDGVARGNDHIVDMQLASDGSLAIAGYSAHSVAARGLQTIIAKFDSELRETWSRSYLAAGHRDSLPVDLTVDSRHSILVTGLTAANLQGDDDAVVPFAVKFGADGLLQAELNGASAGGAAVDVEPSGEFILAGAISRDSRSPAQAGALASSVSRYDRQGNRLWTVPLGEAGSFDVASARIAETGAVYIAGTTNKARGSDYVLLKLSADGLTLWEHRYSGKPGSVGHATDLVLNGGRTLLLGRYSLGDDFDLVALLYGELAPNSVRRGRDSRAE